MEFIREFLTRQYLRLLIPLGVLLVTLAGGWIVRGVLFRSMRRWAVKSNSHLDIILTESLSGPIIIWALILGLDFAAQSAALPERATNFISRSLIALWVISLTIMFSRFAGNMVRFYGVRVAGDLPVTSLTKNLAQLFVVIIGVLILLDILHINITPLLTALGVGGLAVALALQDTLSNLFGGFYVSLARQVRLQDYIKLSTGEEGYVTDISWRSTTIRGLGNNLIIIPNAKLAQAIVTNYYLPERRLLASVVVGVGYQSDPDQVERILLEEASARIEGLLETPPPVVLFAPGFGDSALQFTLTFQVAEFAEQFHVQHELRKRILKRLRSEGIEMPFPTRTVYIHPNA